MKDIRQSPAWAKYLESIGWKIEKINNIFIYLKNIPIFGWYAKVQRPEKLDSKIINFVKSKYHPFQFSIEPINIDSLNLLRGFRFKISNSPSLPSKTLQIDLKNSREDLLSGFSQKTRYNIKLSYKKNIEVIKSKNILNFTVFWRRNFERRRFSILSQQKNIINLHKAFGKNSHILLAKKNNETVAGLLILIYEKVSYYMYAASSTKGKKLYAPTLLTWEAILLSKRLGCRTFDFDGIYDERFPIKTWVGFSKFKEGFGGKEVEYPGCFIKNRFT